MLANWYGPGPPSDHPHSSRRVWGIGVVGGCARGCRGGGGGEESVVNLPSAKKFFIAAMLLRDEDEKGTVLFHSVIFNSVTLLLNSKLEVFLFPDS